MELQGILQGKKESDKKKKTRKKMGQIMKLFIAYKKTKQKYRE